MCEHSLCPKYVCVSSCSNCLLKFVNFRLRDIYTSMYCDTMDFVGKARGQGLAQDHGLVPDHGLVQEISGCLYKSVIFQKSN